MRDIQEAINKTEKYKGLLQNIFCELLKLRLNLWKK
jgi:hypothetical protein